MSQGHALWLRQEVEVIQRTAWVRRYDRAVIGAEATVLELRREGMKSGKG